MIERSLQRNLEKRIEPSNIMKKEDSTHGVPTRPTDLPMEQRPFPNSESQSSYTGILFIFFCNHKYLNLLFSIVILYL